MEHKGTKKIETERLLLRQFHENDAEAMFRNWGTYYQGITTEAFKAIIPFFFEEVGANRIESQHDPNNPGSGKVMKKCGLKYEGMLRQADWSNKGIVDACIYSLLKSEWEGNRYKEKKEKINNRINIRIEGRQRIWGRKEVQSM